MKQKKVSQMLSMLKSHIKKKFTHKEQILEIVKKGDEIIEKEKINQRASKNKLLLICLKIVESKPFKYIIRASIFLNTIALAMDKHPIEK